MNGVWQLVIRTTNPNQRIVKIPEGTDIRLNSSSEYIAKAVGITEGLICDEWGDIQQFGQQFSVYIASAGIPDAPQTPVIINVTADSVLIQFVAPEDMNGAYLLGYNVSVNGDIVTPEYLDDRIDQGHIVQLMANSFYSISTAAITDMGQSQWSDSSTFTTLDVTNPNAVSSIQALNITSSRCNLVWTAPTQSGGAPLIGSLKHIYYHCGESID